MLGDPSGRKQMILRGRPEDAWWQPNPGKNDRCRGPLFYPVLQWMAHYRGPPDPDGWEVDAPMHFICKECCADIHSGFIRDLREMKTLSELKRLGFHKARPTKDTVFVPPEDTKQ
jgi:hypothetical protein